jgi:predicted phosphodiesterase
MRYLVLSDVHSNLEALDACLADAGRRGWDRALVLGDLVGYAADPAAVIERVRALAPAAIVRGNHDKVVSGLEPADGFNHVARVAAEWTAKALGDADRAWLAALPRGPVIVNALIEICHGAPFDEDEYVFDELDAVRALETAARPLCLFGHTHHPIVFELRDGALAASEPRGTTRVALEGEDVRWLVNAGSVGQPRDGDPRAAYAIVDERARAMDIVRVEYDVAAAQRKIVEAGLPEPLAARLVKGR